MRIRYTPDAFEDLEGIRAFLSERDGEDRARVIGQRIRASIEPLATFPLLGQMGETPDTRTRIVTGAPYVVVYRVAEDAVEILHVYHGRQNWRSG